MYLLNINTTAKKTIRIVNSINTNFVQYSKKDMPWLADVDIIVETESEGAEAKKQRNMMFMTFWMQAIQMATNEYSKNKLMREMMKSQGIEEDEVLEYFHPSIDEMAAKKDLDLLSRNEDVWPIDDMTEDHFTYIQVYRRAQQTPARDRAIDARIQAYIKSWQKAQQEAQWQQQWWGEGWVANQLANAAIQQANPQQVGALSNSSA